MRRVILQNFREYPHGAVAKKKSSRGRASRYVSREKWPSLLNARRRSRNGGGGLETSGAPPLSGSAAASAATYSPRAADLTTARPIGAPAAIVYTLPIGSLFFEGVGRRRRRRHALRVQRRERGAAPCRSLSLSRASWRREPRRERRIGALREHARSRCVTEQCWERSYRRRISRKAIIKRARASS